jgi:type I restriction enzyme S subunit
MLTKKWQTVALGKVATLQRGFDLPQRDRRPGSIPIVTSSGIGDTHSESRVAGPGVVTGRYGTIGEVFFIEQDFWPLNTTLFVKDFHGNDPLFVSYLLRTIDFHSHSGKSGVPGVNRNDLHGLDVSRPPLPEQRAIAAALSDVDALIGALDQLIAKKRDLKQAAMQQLLTGQRRLLGFGLTNRDYKQTEVGVIPEDWNVHTLRNCLSAPPDYGINAPAVPFSDKLPAYIRITDITEDGRFFPENPASVKRSDADLYYLKEGDLVFARTGASVGKSYLYKPKDGKLVFAGFLIRVSPDSGKLVPAYLAGYVTTGAFWNWVRLMSMRSGQPGINGNEYGQLPIPLPPTIDEQRAIAAVLSDMDAEIAALEQRRDKTRALKQGMMQELLTGRTRLI